MSPLFCFCLFFPIRICQSISIGNKPVVYAWRPWKQVTNETQWMWKDKAVYRWHITSLKLQIWKVAKKYWGLMMVISDGEELGNIWNPYVSKSQLLFLRREFKLKILKMDFNFWKNTWFPAFENVTEKWRINKYFNL